MTAYFFSNIPTYHLDGFRAVRNAFDNLRNVLNLAEIVNTCSHCRDDRNKTTFDFVIFSGDFTRVLVRKDDGYFSMALPFQIIETGHHLSFLSNRLEEEISGRAISILRNALTTVETSNFSHEDVIFSLMENFGLELRQAVLYCDTFMDLLADDHGYLRFDDDPIRANGEIHPRYHFDFFYKNSTSIKIGVEARVDIGCFYSLFDKSLPKRFMRN